MLLTNEFLDLFSSRIFPLHTVEWNDEAQEYQCSCDNPSCNAPGKHPPQPWKDYLFGGDDSEFRNRNVGIRCGFDATDEKFLLVIDVDEGELSPEPETYTIKTSRGKHYYFYTDKSFRNCTGIKAHGVKFDIRSTGSYVVGEGSVHKSGHIYAKDKRRLAFGISRLPRAFEALLQARTANQPQNQILDYNLEKPPFTATEANAMLERIRLETLNPESPTSHELWIYVSLSAFRAGCTFGAWRAWCEREPGFNPDDNLQARWQSFAKPSARPITWRTFHALYHRCIADNDVEWEEFFNELSSNIKNNVLTFPQGKIDEESKRAALDSLPMLMQDIMRFCNSRMMNKSTKGELASTLTILAACSAHYALTPTNLPTTLYTIYAAEAGTAKSQTKKIVEQILRQVFTEHDWKLRELGKVQSRQALHARLLKFKYRVQLSDEFVQSTHAIFEDFKKEFNTDRIAALLSCFDGEALEASETKKEEDSLARVDNPRLTILGLGTCSMLSKLVSCESFRDNGFSSRVLLFEEKETQLDEDFDYEMFNTSIPKNLVDSLRIIAARGQKNETFVDPDYPTAAEYQPVQMRWENDEAKALFREIDMGTRKNMQQNANITPQFKEFMNRHGNKLCRVASLIGLARGGLTVSAEDIRLADAIVRITNEDMLQHLKFSTTIEALEQRMVECHARFIKKHNKLPTTRDLFREVGSRHFREGGTAKLLHLATTLQLELNTQKTYSLKR